MSLKKWHIISVWVLIWASFAANQDLRAQGGNTCTEAESNLISLPFNSTTQTTCSKGNDYNGSGSCLNPSATGNDFGGLDYLYAVKPNQSGFLEIKLHSVQASGNVSPVVIVFKGCPGSGTCVAAKRFSMASSVSPILLEVDSGQTYFILLDAYTNSTNYKNCYSYKLDVRLVPIVPQPGCTNMGFDAGNFTGWTALTGKAAKGEQGASTPSYTMLNIGPVNGRHEIMTGGTDPCAGFSRVAPGGNGFSVRLGNSSTGTEAEQLRQTFKVTAANSSFTYMYAVVFQDPGHPVEEQPFFKAMLKDEAGNVITCSEFVVAAAANLPGFLNANCAGVKYKPWSTVNVDLYNYIGQNVTVEFTTGDCTQGAHYGYAYIDGFCSPSTIAANRDTICPGQSIQLEAPSGYATYQWLPGGQTTQNITVSPLSTTSYTLRLTSFNGCVADYQIPVVVRPTPVPSFTWEAPFCDEPVSLTNTTAALPGVPFSIQWSMPQGSPVSGGQNQMNVQFPGQGSYPVTLKTITSAGCTSSVSQQVSVPPCVFRATIAGDTICPDSCYTFNVQTNYGVPPYTYQWSTGGTDSSLTLCPQQNTLVSVTVTDGNGSTATDTARIIISTPPTFASTIKNVSCNGGSDGEINVELSGNGPFQYYWEGGGLLPKLDSVSAGEYSLNVRDRFGCPSEQSFEVSEPTQLSASVQAQDPLCGLSNGVLEIFTSGGTAPYEYAIDTSALGSNPRMEGLEIGDYVLRVVDAKGCEIQVNASLNPVSYPISFQTWKRDARCGDNNGEITILSHDGGFGPYQMKINNVFKTYEGSAQFSNLAPGQYLIQLIDSNNCELDTTIEILQQYGPATIFSASSAATCGEDNAKVWVDSISGGKFPYEYKITSGNWGNEVLWSNLAPVPVQIQVRDSNGCTLDTIVNPGAIDKLKILARVRQTVSCNGGADGIADCEILAGPGPYTFEWSNGGTNIEILGLAAGVYSVIVTDSVNCRDTSSVTILQPQPLQATLTAVNPVCNSANGVIEVDSTYGGTAPYRYAIDSVYGSEAVFANLGEGEYRIRVQDSKNCEIELSKTLQMPSVPQEIELSVQDATCGEINGSIVVEGIQGGIAPYSIELDESNSQGTLPAHYAALAEGSHTLKVTDANGCILLKDTIVPQHHSPSGLEISVTPATCELDNATLNIDSTFGGTAPIYFSVREMPESPARYYSALAPGIIPLKAVDANGCTYDTSIQIAAIEKIAIDARVRRFVRCSGFADGRAEVTVLAGPAPYSISWNTGHTTALLDSVPAGTYFVTARDSNGCVDQDSVQISEPAQLGIDISGPDAVCYQEPFTLTATPGGGTAPVTISWLGHPHAGESLSLVADSTKSFKVVATDASGCVTEQLHNISIRPLPTGYIIPESREACAPACIRYQFVSTHPAEIQNHQWKIAGKPGGNKDLERYCFQTHGMKNAVITVRDIYGCSAEISDSGSVLIHPFPAAYFEASPEAADIYDPEISFTDKSGFAITHFWSFGDGTTSTFTDPVHTYPDTGTYTVCLTVNSNAKCKDTYCDEVKILPVPVVFAPSAFTPNGDGTNDVFRIVTRYVEEFNLQIFDRWGEIIFETSSPHVGWDGTYKGKKVQSDMYVWRLVLRDSLHKTHREDGRVTVLE